MRAGEVDGLGARALLTPGAQPDPTSATTRTELLVVDQFEELFTLCDDADLRRAFIDALLAHRPRRGDRGARRHVRARSSAHPELARAVAANQILLGAMTDEELERAVTEPARLAGLRLEPGLVELVLRDVAGEPGALPLLSHALRATWERRDGRTLTVEGYRESGGVASAVARTADDPRRLATRRPAAAGAQRVPAAHRARRGHRRHAGGACASMSSSRRASRRTRASASGAARERPARDPWRGHGRGRPRGRSSESGRRFAAGWTRIARASACTAGSGTQRGCGRQAVGSRRTCTAAPGSRPRSSGGMDTRTA